MTPADAHDLPHAAARHGCRVGRTRTHVNDVGQVRSSGRCMRAMPERADAAWVVSTHETAAEAQAAETLLSLRYGFRRCRSSLGRARRADGVVGDQSAHRRDLRERRHGARRPARFCTMRASGPRTPHHHYRGLRRATAEPRPSRCARDRRGRHAAAHACRSADATRRPARRWTSLGLSVRKVRPDARGLALRTSYFTDFGEAMDDGVDRIQAQLDVNLRFVGRLGRYAPGQANSLPFIHASSVRPRHGHVHRRRRLRHRRDASSASSSTGPVYRPQRRGHAQLRRRRARHAQLDLRLPRRGRKEHPQFSRTTSSTPTSSSSSRTTAPRRPSSPPRTRSSPTTAGGWRRRCGPRSGKAIRSRSGSSPTSTPRLATSPLRSSGWSTRASAGRRSPSSTGPTRSRGCSRTCSCGRRSATRSSAARSSMSGRRSGTPSRT